MAQYFVPAPVMTTQINLGADQNLKQQLPLQGEKNVLTLVVTQENKSHIVFASTMAGLLAGNGIDLTLDTYTFVYDTNSRWFMVYTTTVGSLLVAKAFVNGGPAN